MYWRNPTTLAVTSQPHTFWLEGLNLPSLAAVFRFGGVGRVNPDVGSIYVDRKSLLELCPPGAALNLGGRARASEKSPARPTMPEHVAPALPPSGIRTTQAEKAEEACRTWVSGLSGRPANKDKAFESAQAAITGLSRKAFDRAWANAAPSDWRKAGRPKKSTLV
jgi:hypothetical protein